MHNQTIERLFSYEENLILEYIKSFVRSNIDWYVSQKYNYVLLKVRLDIHTDNKTCS